MVMENEIRLGDILDKLTPSDRVVVYNAARQGRATGNTADMKIICMDDDTTSSALEEGYCVIALQQK